MTALAAKLNKYLQHKSSSPPSEPKPANLSVGNLEVVENQVVLGATLTVTTADAADNPIATPIVSSIPASTKSGDPAYSFYLKQISNKTVKANTKDKSTKLTFGGLKRRVEQKEIRKSIRAHNRLKDALDFGRTNTVQASRLYNSTHDEVISADEEPVEINIENKKVDSKVEQIMQHKNKVNIIKKLEIKSRIYDDTKITKQGNEKLIVKINDPKEPQEIEGATAPHTNTYEVSKTNDNNFTMTTKDPLDTIGDKMLVQWIETFKRTEGPNKIMVISDLFHDDQSPEDKTKAQEIAGKIKQYCSSADVRLKINREPEPENTASPHRAGHHNSGQGR